MNVWIGGTTTGTSTDQEGRYVIAALPPGETVVQASFVGFKTAQQRVQLVAGDTVRVDFALEVEIIEEG